MDAHIEIVHHQKNLFGDVRVRYVILWLLLGAVLDILLIFYFKFFGYDKTLAVTGSLIAIQGMLVLWAVTEMKRAGISIKRLFWGNGFDRSSWKHFLMVIPGFIFSIGSLILFVTSMAWFFHLNTDSLIGTKSNDLVASPDTLAIPWLYYALVFVATIIIAPIAEELAFRGMLINRWGLKWGIGHAIVLSSLLFGVLHGITFIGTIVFALIIALIYLRTRSLVPGIIFHAINNLIPFFATIQTSISGGGSADMSELSLRDLFVSGALLVGISLPIIIVYCYKNWPAKNAPLPYMAVEGELAQ